MSAFTYNPAIPMPPMQPGLTAYPMQTTAAPMPLGVNASGPPVLSTDYQAEDPRLSRVRLAKMGTLAARNKLIRQSRAYLPNDEHLTSNIKGTD